MDLYTLKERDTTDKKKKRSPRKKVDHYSVMVCSTGDCINLRTLTIYLRLH